MDKTTLGQYGEEIAEKYLKKKGFKIIARNYKTQRWGEIDRIAIDNDTLVFVEVRTKTSSDFMAPQETITSHKLQSLKRAANYYCLENDEQKLPEAQRIDFIGVTFDNKNNPTIEHFENITRN
ncbi:MAG: YraN family protein [Candidatus Cloacimonetes bacterium]|nr:YraN family protein [Candidatus Cloacimonadota bacterium]